LGGGFVLLIFAPFDFFHTGGSATFWTIGPVGIMNDILCRVALQGVLAARAGYRYQVKILVPNDAGTD